MVQRGLLYDQLCCEARRQPVPTAAAQTAVDPELRVTLTVDPVEEKLTQKC